MSILNMIFLSLWVLVAAAADTSAKDITGHDPSTSLAPEHSHISLFPSSFLPVTTISTGTTFTISTITSRPKATGPVGAVTPSPMAPGDTKALIYVRCDRFRINEGHDLQHGNIWLDAYCRDDQGQLWHSVINLNHCLQNNAGTLEPAADGDFAQTCWMPALKGSPATFMTVFCSVGGQPNRQVSFDFETNCGSAGYYLGNSDVLSINAEGDFECFGIHECAWNHSDCIDKPDGVHG
ncbi:hypothetical protein PG995_010998 [Apiospora arundinis]